MRGASLPHPKLVLASNSPRRKELLELGGWEFTIEPADVDETPLPGENPRDYVVRMSESKAAAAAMRADPDILVLGADTTVVYTDPTTGAQEILGKPVDDNDARRMLTMLRGRVHQVVTSVTVVQRSKGIRDTEVCSTDVPMREYTDEELAAYIATGDPLDKAGAYAIQHEGFHPAEQLTGCYTNVMGLPVCHAARLLSRHGYPPPADLAKACRDSQEYECPIFTEIYKGEG